MREKIVAVIFSIILVAIPLMTIGKKILVKEEPETTQEGSIAELNREEQLHMQEALEQNVVQGEESGAGEQGSGTADGATASQEEESKGKMTKI